MSRVYLLIYSIMDLTNRDSLTFDEVEDVLTVFVSSIRSLNQSNQLDGKKYLFYKCRLDLEVEDADLLESIWKNKDFIPNDIVPKKKRGIATRNKSKDDKEIDFALKFTYINKLIIPFGIRAQTNYDYYYEGYGRHHVLPVTHIEVEPLCINGTFV